MAASVDLVAKRGLAITDLNGKLRRGSSRRRGVDWHESRHAGHGDVFLLCDAACWPDHAFLLP